ncbi:MAG: 16S rRNA (guanine(966)-N(2))-methyltransferase RsmD [Clostridiales Family XIII bacterium]|nr:16S rRNA (guanine(966)-N(2))-methyltransferase RsmD [Clostridiales Family XIII bacterium]
MVTYCYGKNAAVLRGGKERSVLRVIAGEARGRRLFSPEDRSIRPTADKVKGAIFSMIGAHIPDAVVADLFSGSGGLGIEALSRGARRCYFCDNSPKARALIEKNLAHCGLADRAEVLHGDCGAAFDRMSETPGIVLLDPPYDRDYYASCLAAAGAAFAAAAGGLAVAEHSAARPLPDRLLGFVKIREKCYGATGVSVFLYEG